MGSDNGSGDMINPESAGPSKAVEVQTAVQQVEDGGMPNVPCVLTEFVDILLRPAKKGRQRRNVTAGRGAT